ncbi:MAG: substrate-binding domain-containing protein [Bacteroidales bacterium]|jgi:LacI family transcriptional regulator|nr:substrate-binding domain-containing protein [Bacteroidales bacterium]
MEKRVSLKDIASRVGVSVALVSYVLNGKEKEMRVSAEVVAKVRQAAEEMNYEPNQIARSLRMGATKTIGLVVADISNPFFGHLARIIEDEAFKSGYTVIFGSSDEDEEKSAMVLRTLQNRQADGYIIVPSEGTTRQISGLLRKKRPVVLVDRYFPELNCSHIVLNNYQATFDATSHLIGKGCKRIALVAYRTSLIHMKERIRGYAEAMSVSGLPWEDLLIEVEFGHTQAETDNALNKFLEKNRNVDGMVFSNNGLSLGGLYYMQKYCIRVPRDLAFIGFDGGEAFDLYPTPLSYVSQPLEEMGREAVKILMDQLHGTNRITQIMLTPTLIIREASPC